MIRLGLKREKNCLTYTLIKRKQFWQRNKQHRTNYARSDTFRTIEALSKTCSTAIYQNIQFDSFVQQFRNYYRTRSPVCLPLLSGIVLRMAFNICSKRNSGEIWKLTAAILRIFAIFIGFWRAHYLLNSANRVAVSYIVSWIVQIYMFFIYLWKRFVKVDLINEFMIWMISETSWNLWIF